MKRINFLQVVAVIGVAVAMLFPAFSQVNATGVFTDSGIILPGVRFGSLAWGDFDNDGHLDLAICGNTGSAYITRIYRNNGDNTFTDIGAGLTGVNWGSLAWGDYDNDGDLDLAVCGCYDYSEFTYHSITKIYRNNGDSTFTDIGAGLTGVKDSSLAWGDYDNDGDLDLALCGDSTGYGVPGAITKIYRNNGNNTFTDIGAGLTGVYEGSIAWGDYDNDGNLDLEVSGHATAYITKIYRNNGNNTFTDIGAGLTGVYGALAWGDYNNDGYLDLGAWKKIYKNNGDDTFTDIVIATEPSLFSSAAWGDYDNDGDLDLVVCGMGAGEQAFARIYRNNGNNTFTDIGAGLFEESWGSWPTSPAWGDYDNDGDLDLALCGPDGITRIYKNNGGSFNTPPSAPTNLTYEEGSAILKWNSGSDDETPDTGLYYNIRVGTVSKADYIVSGVYGSPLLGNYLRPKLSNNQLGVTLKNLPTGTYYWNVQTIDTSLEASEWSDTATFSCENPTAITETVPESTPTDVVVSDGSGVNLTTDSGSGDVNVTVVESEVNTYGYTGMAGGQGLDRTLEITSDAPDGSFVAVIKFAYTDEELAELGISETNMRIYHWDDDTQTWVAEGTVDWGNSSPPDPATAFNIGWYGVDTTNNFAWAVVDHFSIFGAGNKTGSGGGGGGKSGCFIATACFGTPMASEVVTLRQFRDERLLTNPIGRVFVNTYYKVSPPIADFIGQYPMLKNVVRETLKPLIWMSEKLIE